MVRDDKESSQQIRIRGDSSSFAAEMRKLVNNKEFSDIKFLIGPQRKPMYAHRCIVVTRCQVFKAFLTDQQNKIGKADTETPLVFSDIQPDVFLAVLEFIYTNMLTISPRMAFDTIGAAIEYGLDDLQKAVVAYLQNNMSAPNACEALRVAVTYSREDLKQRTLAYIEERTPEVFRDKTFQELSESALSLVLQSDRLSLDELDILAAVREWANTNSVAQGKAVAIIVKGVIGYVRLSLLSPEELAKIEEDNKKDFMIPAEHFSTAWKGHALKRSSERMRKGTKRRSHHSWVPGGNYDDE